MQGDMSQHEDTSREITKEPGRVSVDSTQMIACGEREQVSVKMGGLISLTVNLHKEYGEDPAKTPCDCPNLDELFFLFFLCIEANAGTAQMVVISKIQTVILCMRGFRTHTTQ